MKKALAMGLGALLVAGSAMPASAASQIDFSGYYNLWFTNVWNQNGGTKDTQTSWSGFTNRLNLDFAFHATDEVSVFWRLRAPQANKWGDGSTYGATTYHAYGQIKQDWGTILIGKLADPNFYTGLSNLGWRPDGPDGSGWFTSVNPFDIADSAFDGIRYANRWDNIQLVAQFNRIATGQTSFNSQDGDEAFTDFYLLEGGYFWDGGGATLGLHYLTDHATDYPLDHPKYGGSRLNDGAAVKIYYINPAVSHSFGNGFGIHFEGKYGIGVDDSLDSLPMSKKLSGYAAYLDVDYNYGPGNVNLAGWYASGEDDNSGDPYAEHKGMVGMGAEFKPLLVAYGDNAGHRGRTTFGAVAAANEESGTGTGKGAFNALGSDDSNHWAVALSGNHAFTDDISLSYAIAKLSLNKVQQGRDKDIGFEVDLGLQLQLLDNVKLGTAIGYLAAGDALKDSGSGEAPEDIYAWLSTLTFSF